MADKTIGFARNRYLDIIYAVAFRYHECITNIDAIQPEYSIRNPNLVTALINMDIPEINDVLEDGPYSDIWDLLQEVEDCTRQKTALGILADFANLYPDFGQESINEGFRYLLARGISEDEIHGYAQKYLNNA